jgi:hypothetical protein
MLPAATSWQAMLANGSTKQLHRNSHALNSTH